MQVVPHITDAIIEWIEKVSQTPIDGKLPEVTIIELGGVVGYDGGGGDVILVISKACHLLKH